MPYKLTHFLLDRKILKKVHGKKKTFEKYAKSLVANFNFSSDDPNTRRASSFLHLFYQGEVLSFRQKFPLVSLLRNCE